MNPPTVLILDDDDAFARAAGHLAYQEGYRLQLAGTVRDARDFLQRHGADLLLLDLDLPDGSGLDLLDDLDMAQHGQVAVITGKPSIETARRAVGSQVVEYLLKPLRAEQLQDLLRRAMRRHWPGRDTGAAGCLARLPGNSEPMRRVMDTLLRVAPSDSPVLVTGESGTGKELAARVLHDASGRTGAFVSFRCSDAPNDRLAEHLFGSDGDAPGGASAGAVAQARGGTLFLADASELPLQLQSRLLRAMESGLDIDGAGSGASGARLVLATARDPSSSIAGGSLRADLYYAIANLPIHLPPLRERGDDVVLLTELFIQRLNAHYGRNKRLAPGEDRELLRHAWPGNVRELRGAVQRSYLLQRTDLLQVRPNPCAGGAARGHAGPGITFAVGMTLDELERQAVQATLAHFGNDKRAAAKALGVSVRTIYNHLARMSDDRHHRAAASAST